MSDCEQRSWLGFLFSTNPTTIGLRYLYLACGGGVVALLSALMLQFELFDAEGTLQPETYVWLLSLHGFAGIFGALVPGLLLAMAYLLLPAALRVPNIAFPRLGVVSWGLWTLGIAIMLVDVVFEGGSANAPSALLYVGWACEVAARLMTLANLAVTIARSHRANSQLPLFAIAVLWVCFLQLLTLGLATVGFANEDTTAFTLSTVSSANTLPLRGLLLAVPIGIASDLLLPRNGHKFLRSALHVAIAWSAMSPLLHALGAWSILDLIATLAVLALWRRSARSQAPRSPAVAAWVLGAGTTLIVAALATLLLSSIPVDVHLHDTYFVVGRFHYVASFGLMVLAAVLVDRWPQIRGREPDRMHGTWGARLTVVGVHVAFFSQFLLGHQGMPRRYYSYIPQFETQFRISGFGCLLVIVGVVLTVLSLSKPRSTPAVYETADPKPEPPPP